MPDPSPLPHATSGGHSPLQGWSGFLETTSLVEMAVLLIFAMGLGAIIAYHPQTRRSVTSLEDYHQPKTHILYAMVGALIAQIVSVQPEMALVIFGIGGLLRFRTDVGAAKDTGRVILVTVIGLCTGLELFVVAVLGTILGWIVIFALDRPTAGRVSVTGLENAHLTESARAYAAALTESGFVLLGEEKNPNKGRFSLVFKARSAIDRAKLAELEQRVPETLRGSTDWEIS
jgi:uncharacterized membrane protein YhiD involved in acid resistance